VTQLRAIAFCAAVRVTAGRAEIRAGETTDTKLASSNLAL
jgi:hypothetical protein